MKFYIVTEGIKNQYHNQVKDSLGISFVQDLQGRWVVNESMKTDWPEIDWEALEIVELTINDFPQTEVE